MKSAVAFAALAAGFLFTSPALAYDESGMGFYNSCGTGAEAGFFNRPFCHGYLSGFYDALAATGKVCPQGGIAPNDTQIVMVVQNWMRTYAANLNSRPAHIMIRNAILNAWGCPR
ncbi:MAG TPA: Rap1a/Tai family immunity protein [Rhizomicrobium sp.]|nr:Rap1a/Tai family immunity protein [Rhizomicrobium sp.]